jgi:hypothetical protein
VSRCRACFLAASCFVTTTAVARSRGNTAGLDVLPRTCNGAIPLVAPEYCPCNEQPFAVRLDALRNLDRAPPTPARSGPLDARQRGYCVEALLYDVMLAEGLAPRASYRPAGEQIDGSFVIHGRPLLLEAKWVKDPIPASAIYAFKGKVDGKLVGTIGLMLAVNGFSEDAIPALTAGKEVNVLLASGDDLAAALDPPGSFTAMVAHKIRAAIDEGVVFAPYRLTVDGTASATISQTPDRPDVGDISFVVEGPLDAEIVGHLGRKVLDELGAPHRIVTLPALGKINGARLVASVRDALGPQALVGLVVDADDESAADEQQRLGSHDAVRGRQVIVIAAEPTLEAAWLGVPPGEHRSRRAAVREALPQVDLAELRRSEPSFDRFALSLEQHVRASGWP